MMSLSKFVVFSVVIFSLYFIQSAVSSPDENVEKFDDICQCPPFMPKINFSDVEDAKKAQIFLVESLWNRMELSTKGNELKKEIFDLVRSENPFWKEVALACTVWTYANSIKDVSERNLCKFAKLINSTVPWQTKNDCSVMTTAIEDVVSSINNGAHSVFSSGIRNSECGSGEIIPDPPKCFENGTIYDIKELWDLNGDKLPSRLREITMSLYKSNDFIDQLLAIVTTTSLSLPLRLTVIHFDQNVMYGLFHGSIPDKIETCCCESYKDFMNNFLEICVAAVDPFTGLVKQIAKCA